MPQPRPHSAPGTDGYRVRSAPYALARATVLAHPAQHPAAAAFRDLLTRLHRLDTELALTAAPLCDDLYAARDSHPADFHRDTVLPLRRALHNRREPRPALLARLGDLPARLPRLAAWLALRADRATLLTALDTACGPALDAERAALAALCREPALAKATALTSADLLRAMNRAATGTADRRARKEEPTVLRYALRASTKTSPLSWFTAVGWGPLAGDPADGPARPVTSWGAAPVLDGPLRSVVRANRTLTTALTLALLDAPHRRTTFPTASPAPHGPPAPAPPTPVTGPPCRRPLPRTRRGPGRGGLRRTAAPAHPPRREPRTPPGPDPAPGRGALPARPGRRARRARRRRRERRERRERRG